MELSLPTAHNLFAFVSWTWSAASIQAMQDACIYIKTSQVQIKNIRNKAHMLMFQQSKIFGKHIMSFLARIYFYNVFVNVAFVYIYFSKRKYYKQ